jgi:hypothetical protein
MSYLPYGSETFSGWLLATGSSVLAHGAVVAMTWGGFMQLVAVAPEAAPRPEYRITLERLDSDTLAGLLERRSTDVAANPDAGPDEDPRALDQQDAALPPALPAALPLPETPLPIAPEAAGSETAARDIASPAPDAIGVAPAAGVTAPESGSAPDPVAEALAPLDTATPELAPVAPSDAMSAGPLIAETLTPISPIAAEETGFAAVAVPSLGPQDRAVPDQVAVPVQRVLSTAVAPLSRLDGIAPAEGPSAPAAAVPNPAGPPTRAATRSAAPPTAQDLAVGDLIARIRAAPADPCLLALPRRDGSDGVGLELVAATDSAMAEFTAALLTAEDAAIRQTRTLIDPRQCAVIGYLRDNRDYPATRLGIALDAAEVPSGGDIGGVLRGIAGRYVLLVIVDNNGVVQDLQRFMSFSGNFARFSVPVTRVGPARDTSQLLIAIGTDQPAATLRARDGQLAADVFRDLDAAQGRNAAIGFATFDVR